ncbi:helix-turn-helix domain-containing protein [Tetragenococcus halophilus]|nr:helix-turn-helix domain-containing protein [Tetragenococcus halophilus]
MRFVDLLDKDQKVQVRILTYFLQHAKTIKVKDLNYYMDVSYPTLQKEITALADRLHNFEISAELSRKDNDFLQLNLPYDFSVKNFLYSYLKQAINYRLLVSIYQEKELTVTKLALDNNLSESTKFLDV